MPVLALIDARLAAGETDGWHYDELPEDGQAWRDSLRFLDDDAGCQHGRGFAHLISDEQAALIQLVQKLASDGEQWHGWSAKHVWSLWTRYACTAFYSHPWAWNEIGFPGPAYPRGYLNPGVERPRAAGRSPTGTTTATPTPSRSPPGWNGPAREHAQLLGSASGGS